MVPKFLNPPLPVKEIKLIYLIKIIITIIIMKTTLYKKENIAIPTKYIFLKILIIINIPTTKIILLTTLFIIPLNNPIITPKISILRIPKILISLIPTILIKIISLKYLINNNNNCSNSSK